MSKLLSLPALLLASLGISAADPPARTDLVEAIRKKAGLEPKAFNAKAKELKDTLTSAKKGVINPSLDTKVKKPKKLGSDGFVFRSVKIKQDFVAESESAIKEHELLADNVAKDLKKYVGFMGRPETGSVGHLSTGKKQNTVFDIIDANTMAIFVPYKLIIADANFAPREDDREELLIVSGIDTSKYGEGRGYDFDIVFHVGDTYKWSSRQVIQAKPVVLTEAEKRLVSGK